jgi:hypothetical protein
MSIRQYKTTLSIDYKAGGVKAAGAFSVEGSGLGYPAAAHTRPQAQNLELTIRQTIRNETEENIFGSIV